MSKSKLGKTFSEEHKLALSNGQRGKKKPKFSDEHINKLSKAKMKFSLEQELEIVRLRKQDY